MFLHNKGEKLFTYKNNINFNYDFKRSINISSSDSNCNSYRLTNLTSKLIDSIIEPEYNTNSFALIGSFGTGKSAFLLFLDLLLKKNFVCLEKLKKNKVIYDKYQKFIQNKEVFVIKFTGEYSSFKEFFRNTIINDYSELQKTIKYLKKDNFLLDKALAILESEIKEFGYSDIFFFFDEFGKLLSYGLNVGNKNDVSDLQIFSEYANNSNSLKLIITLHRNVKDYANNTMSLNYNEWTKIQGRFETILFEYNSLELINIVSNSFYIKDKLVNKLSSVLNNSNEHDEKPYKDMYPLHPFTTLAVSKLFSKYFQNNRSIYSFLFSNEPYSFKEFINKEYDREIFYSLSKLYDYMYYLSKAYDVKIPDRETWYLSDEYISKNNFSNIELDIIKVISLVQAYKIESDIKLNLSNITFSLKGEYDSLSISDAVEGLVKKNLLLINTHNEYHLLDESNIDLYKEMENERLALTNINYCNLINHLIAKDNILAKKFFATTGNKKYFKKFFIENLDGNYSYKILFFNNVKEEDVLKVSLNSKSIYVPLTNKKEIFRNLDDIEILNTIKQKFNTRLTNKTNNIIESMINEKRDFILSFFKFNNGFIGFYNGKKVIFNSKTIQHIITEVFIDNFKSMPIINNYTFNHSSRINVAILRKLFVAMLSNSNKRNIGFDENKFPAEKALYISVIKASGIHRYENEDWRILEPNDLNFNDIWLYLKKVLSNKIIISNLIELLKEEPYGLDYNSSLLMITLFIIVNKNNTFIFRENTYKYSLDDDLLINITRAPHKFEIKYVELSELELELFEVYLKITNNFKSTEYTRNSVKDIISKLYGNFNVLPEYARNTQKLSKKAIELRKALLISKTPYEGLFKLFPLALGYDNLEDINHDSYIKEFKESFNEIVSSYKDIMVELSVYISSVFKLDVKHYPYNNEFKRINELLIDKKISIELQTFLNTFINTDSFRDYINGVSIIINEKNIDDSYDNDILNLKYHLKSLGKELLSSIEISNLAGENKEVRKLKLSLLEKEVDETIIIEKKRLDQLNNYTKKIRKNIPNNLNKNQRLYILSELIKEELNE